ncbi:cell envelope integrity protein TolA [Streptomyces sp. B22F1]|uniref:cell envelope integrity protein TolA n=1 Tax=Streptomyces sp. B22F1 TaxID=3153566 RepID=UPI00325E38C2
MNADLPVPSEGELYKRIADRVGVDSDRIAEVLTSHGLELTGSLPAKRELVVHRLICEGRKTGTTGNDGPFTVDMGLGRGPWVISSSINSAGKSSLLWALSFALRGEGFDAFCRPETVSWFRFVRVDIEVGGAAASIRLYFDKPGRPSVRLLTADSISDLLVLEGRAEGRIGVRLAATAEPSGVKGLIGRFMMERLGLQSVSVWVAESNAPKDEDGNRDSTEQVHGWASFFYAIALNSASDSLLLGPTLVGQLPVKLMQLFLDVPYAPELSRLTTLRKAETQEVSRVARRAKEDARARDEQAAPLRKALEVAQQRLRGLEAGRPDVGNLVAAVDHAAAELAPCQAAYQEAAEQHQAAKKSRQSDQRAERRAKQSGAARLLLGALDPEVCPRCDHDIDDERRAAEDNEHQCSVCARPLPSLPQDPQAQADALARIEARLAASKTAEDSCAAALATATERLTAARATYDQSVAQLEKTRSSDWFALFDKAQREVDQLQGAVTLSTGGRSGDTPPALVAALAAAKPAQKTSVEQGPDDETLLTAAAEVIKDVVDQHSRALFSELNDEIVQIAHDLGVTNLTSVNLSLGGQLNAVKSGSKHRFSAFSPVDRLRMRIAVVVGMIKVSRRRGIMSHPGLLLIDAPTAEELTPQATYQVLDTLYRTGNKVPGLQMIITSIEEAVWDIYPKDRIVTGTDGRELF